MNRTTTVKNATRIGVAVMRRASLLAGLVATVGLSGCSANGDGTESVSQARQAVEADPLADSCGYQVSTGIYARWDKKNKQGIGAWIELHNISGELGTDFAVFVDAGGTEVTESYHADVQAVDGGYLFTAPEWLQWETIPQGDSYRFEFQGADPNANFTPYIVSINGTSCDPVGPEISLEASGTFFIADDTLTLTAEASDNVLVHRVVFEQDGEVIAVDQEAPYTLDVPITEALNGGHVYTATAYDPSANAASDQARVLVAIGNKFFGTAPGGAEDYEHLLAYFDQLTPENAGKWGSVEATRDEMNWTELDTAYDFAQDHGLRFKLHTLVWKNQQPGWLAELSAEEQLAEIEEWMAALAERYPDLEMIDVVNEPLHAVPDYSEALGGAGETGYDWVITAFEMAREHFPASQLILNDYNILQLPEFTAEYVPVIELLQERGLVDGIGVQAHYLERAEIPVVQANLDTLGATGLPIYASELDINFANDARQANRMRDLFPVFWEHPAVVGVTHWGHLQGSIYRQDAYLVRSDGSERPVLEWLVCYLGGGGSSCTVPEYVPEPRVGDEHKIILEAEDYDDALGLIGLGNTVAYTDDGEWESFERVNLDANYDTLSIKYAKGNEEPASVTIHAGSLESDPLIEVELPPTGDWGSFDTVSVPWAPISGEYSLFVAYHGSWGVANIDYFEFGAPAGLGPNIIANSDFEDGTTSGWYTWNGADISVTSDRAVSGTQSLLISERPGNNPAATNLKSLAVPGKTYQLSLWVSIGGAASANINVTQKTQCAGGSVSYDWIVNPTEVVDGEWVNLTADVVVPDCSLDILEVYAEGPPAGVDLYVDHASVRMQQTANIVPNGTFESGSSGWYTWGDGVTISATSDRAHSGTQSLLVTGGSATGPAATDLASVAEAGLTYAFSFWVTIDGPDTAPVHITREMKCGDSTTWTWIKGNVTVSNGEWVELAGYFDVPADCDLQKLQLYAEGSTAADLYVDDVAVLAPMGGNVLPDGDFESGTTGAWSTWNDGNLYVTDALSHGGTYSLMVGDRTENAPAARGLMGLVEPGETYQVSFWVAIGGAASADVNLTTKTQCDGGSANYNWIVGSTSVNEGEWVNLVGTLDVPDCTLADVAVWAEGPPAGVDLYVDDVVVSQ